MNKHKIVDAKDQSCPLPLIMTKKALKEYSDGFILLINNQAALDNVERFLSDNKIKFKTLEENSFSKIYINLSLEENHRQQSEPSNSFIKKKLTTDFGDERRDLKNLIGTHVVCIKSNKMGYGSDELGEILLKAFINNLKEITPLPSNIIFYNEGIMLTLKKSPVLESLKALESSGVAILICGACTTFYNAQDDVSVGIISNMHEITEILTKTSNIIYP